MCRTPLQQPHEASIKGNSDKQSNPRSVIKQSTITHRKRPCKGCVKRRPDTVRYVISAPLLRRVGKYKGECLPCGALQWRAPVQTQFFVDGQRDTDESDEISADGLALSSASVLGQQWERSRPPSPAHALVPGRRGEPNSLPSRAFASGPGKQGEPNSSPALAVEQGEQKNRSPYPHPPPA
jgi:hypothetical protein